MKVIVKWHRTPYFDHLKMTVMMAELVITGGL